MSWSVVLIILGRSDLIRTNRIGSIWSLCGLIRRIILLWLGTSGRL